MVKKERQVRTLARTATKSQEKALIDNAKKLYENPLIILPTCSTNDAEKHMRKLQKKLNKIHRFRDDSEKLEKLSKKKGIEGALAGTLILVHSEKAPYLAVAPFTTGNVVYAQRGKADREKLIAFQYVDDPVLRLLAVKDIALKKRLNIYSWDTGYVCTGKTPAPPKEFVTFLLNKLTLEKHKDISCCKHLTANQVAKKEFSNKYYLRIHWNSINHTIAQCEECAKQSKNTLFTLSKNFITPKLSNEFDIEVMARIIDQKDDTHQTLFLDEYLAGTITDYELIQKNVKKQKETVHQKTEKLLVLNGVSYGSDVIQFLDAFKPNRFERIGLEYILNKIDEPVIASNTTPHQILEKYWNTYGKEVISSLIKDQKMVESFTAVDDTPSNILKMISEYNERQQILGQLPSYTSLPPLARFADHIARTYRTFGEKQTLAELKKRPDNPKGKSLAYAFLLIFNKAEETKWQYTHIEIEYGQFLKSYAKNLLDSSPEQYTTTLQELLTASGSNETIT